MAMSWPPPVGGQIPWLGPEDIRDEEDSDDTESDEERHTAVVPANNEGEHEIADNSSEHCSEDRSPSFETIHAQVPETIHVKVRFADTIEVPILDPLLATDDPYLLPEGRLRVRGRDPAPKTTF